jgi:hypothetical protein
MAIINREMRENAEAFIIRWRGTTAERAEAQTFTNEFFKIFGLDRKNLAQFEKPIQKKDETGTGFADLFWSGKLIIESKSAHLDNPKHWDKTLIQAEEYIENLLPHQRPQFIMLMNFKRIKKFTVEVNKSNKVKITFLAEIPLENLAIKLDEFTFFLEFANRLETDEEKVNQEAANRIANVYNAIERKGYDQNDIAILLAQILFCLFADDTGIFECKQFEKYIRDNTTGKTLGDHLLALFETLNTPVKNRKALNEDLNKFPYVNGDLYKTQLNKVPPTTNALRDALLECCAYDWSDISPVIFGSLFQAVMNNIERRSLGAHYTSEKNILRVVKPLFLDKLHEEFDSIKSNKNSLENFRKKLNELHFLDPACGCGNFLVVTYRELRLLDIEIIRRKYKGSFITDASTLSNVPLGHFYGYEIDPTSAMIAEVAMWLTQHQMNMRLESEFGKAVPTIPLHEAAIIKNVNSLLENWETNERFVKGKGDVIVPFDYILGNPPFVGKHLQNTIQKKDMEIIFNGVKGAGVLDYVAAWYIKAAQYLQKNNAIIKDKNKKTTVAFVSTNSISQGEQVGLLWNELFNNYKIKIHFAHRTFKWSNEAKENAGVHVVIIGFSNFDIQNKIIYEYQDIKGEPIELKVKNINPYLVEGKDFAIPTRSKPINNVPDILFGSKLVDDGNFLFTDEEKNHFISKEPFTAKHFRKILSGDEFINGKTRWCLWLKDVQPNEIKESKLILERVQNVKEFRKKSTKIPTQKAANFPTLFAELRQPNNDFLLIPLTTSENRKYIPLGFFSKNYIVTNSCSVISDATLFHFGILTSEMHMTWVKYVCGRLESRYRYSNSIVYNNYPWPNNPTTKQIKSVETAAQKVLEIRSTFPNNSLADLYDQFTMPPVLVKAHCELDKAVDKCYRENPFSNELKRIEYLFELYDTYTS